MGSGQAKKKQIASNSAQDKLKEDNGNNKQYDDDVIDATNVAIAIQKEDLTTNIEIFIHCENLPKMDAFSLTDPMVVGYQDKENKWVEMGKTEMIPESLNPKFVRTFVVAYNFDRKQKLLFEVYDVDDDEQIDQIDRQEFIGFVECEIHDIVLSPNSSITRTIINKKTSRKRNCIMHIRGVEYDIGDNKTLFHLGVTGFAGKGDIQLKINYFTEIKDWMPVYQSKTQKNVKKSFIQWDVFYLSGSKFGNDENAQLKIEVEEFSKSKGSTMLGELEMSLTQMMENSGKIIRMTKNGLITGQIKLIEVKQHSRYTFLNYVYSGAKIQLMLAVDFTNSNKSPEEQGSLHQLQNTNDYIQAMEQVLGNLQYYNNENRYLMYGFGAKLPPYYNIVSHCFSCTGNIFNPYIYGGIDEVVKVYQETLQAIKLHGPTVFSQVIEQAIFYAASEKIDQSNQKYYILIIFTDGTIYDMQATIDQLYKAQDVPLSIIIVGIGKEDFSQMSVLDSDEGLLFSKSNNQYIKRYIVQFVPFNKYRHNQEKLIKEVLAEIPKQVLFYFLMKKFLEFMDSNKIIPLKGKKSGKAATNEFIHAKIDELRKLKKRETPLIGKVPLFLRQKKEDFINQLIMLGYNGNMVSGIVNDGIPTMDVNLVIELISEIQKVNPKEQTLSGINKINYRNDIKPSIIKSLKQQDRIGHRVFRIRQHNKLDQLLQMKKQETHLITKQFLSNLEKTKVKSNQQPPNDNQIQQQDTKSSKKTFQTPLMYQREALEAPEMRLFSLDENLCLECHTNKIQLVFIPCGHACSCYQCYSENTLQKCLSCNQKVMIIAQIDKQ